MRSSPRHLLYGHFFLMYAESNPPVAAIITSAVCRMIAAEKREAPFPAKPGRLVDVAVERHAEIGAVLFSLDVIDATRLSKHSGISLFLYSDVVNRVCVFIFLGLKLARFCISTLPA